MTGDGGGRTVLVTHSTSPRGGMVHTLALAEALQTRGHRVHLVSQGDPAVGLFRPTDVPHTVLPAPAKTGTLTDRVFATGIDLLTLARPTTPTAVRSDPVALDPT